LFGQIVERTIYGGVVYKTSGLGFSYQNKLVAQNGIGKQFDLELTTYHHPQETKIFNSELNNPSPYVFGKLNKVAIFKTQYCVTKEISKFSENQRVGIDLVGGTGISVGFLKPVYLNLIYPDGFGYEITVSEKYNPTIHTDKTRIAGYSDGRIGLNEINYKVGISVNAGVGFTWGYFTDFPKRLELGYYSEYFNNGLLVMAFTKNKSFQNGVYIKMFFGKRTMKN